MTKEELEVALKDATSKIQDTQTKLKEANEAGLKLKADADVVVALELKLSTLEGDKNELKNAFDALTLEFKKGNSVNQAGFEDQVKSFIADNFEKIKEINTSKSGVIELQLKAVANLTTGSGVNTSPPNITGTQQAQMGNINLRDLGVIGLTSMFQTDLGAYPYTESTPKDGDYTFLAEGGTKPQIDFVWETNYSAMVFHQIQKELLLTVVFLLRAIWL
jgi:hypothetical protein